ncbi:MAG: hypothetical protein A6F70_05255 [Cycloclasticus sp. symbiont of Bathymodiolus heckerae]|nr:MAG: hypothetical protein A6F70_05255 [Cycloclasticus sp. symbiont of Bathymodiolus heckerae]
MSIRNLSDEELNSLFPIRNFSDGSKAQLKEMIKTEGIEANSILFSSGSSSSDQQIYLYKRKGSISIGEQ